MNVFDFVNTLTTDELRVRLAAYMEKDPKFHAPLVAVEVRLNAGDHAGCRYDVYLIDKEGTETPIKFHDRFSRLIYIYTLLHPQGYQRRKAAADNYSALCRLYSLLYFKDGSAVLKTVNSTDAKHPGHFLSQYISQARNAVRNAVPYAEQFLIDRPQSHNGKTLIPFAADGGTVILDATLSNCIHNL